MAKTRDVKYWCAPTIHRYENGVMVDIMSGSPAASDPTKAYIQVVLKEDHDAVVRELTEQIDHLEAEVYD